MAKYDAIIVGAGVGGLTAAARMVKSGARVLVVDRNTHPGGTAYVYMRKGYSFPMGPLGFSSPALVKNTLRSFDQADGFELKRVHYRLRAFGVDAPLSLPFPEMLRELTGIFPDERAGIQRFFAEVERIAAAMWKPEDADKDMLRDASETFAGDFLTENVSDPRLRRILGSIGANEPYSALPLLAAMWRLMCEEGVYYPIGGMKSFCDRLGRAVTSGGGEIRLKTEIAGIRIEKGRALGIALKDGSEIEARAVISNADFKYTFLHLVDKSAVPADFLARISNAKQTMSNLQISLGIEASRVDLRAFNKGSRIIYRGETQTTPDWKAHEIDPVTLAGQEIEMSLWSAEDKSLAPEGGAVLVIRTEADHAHFLRFRPSCKKRSPGYLDYKTRLANALVKEVSKIVPGLEAAIAVMDVATPLTYEEMGGRSGGAVAGWSWDYADSRDYRAREMILTPIAGLYMAGYQAYSSLFFGGVPTAIMSGLKAAEATLANKGPADEVDIPA